MAKKVRSDAWETKLGEDTQSRIYLAAGGARNFHEVKVILKDQFPEVKIPAERTWYSFMERMRNNAAMLLQRAAAAARDVKTMAETQKFDRTDLINSFQTLAAEAEFAGDHERGKALFDVVFQLARIDQKNEELRIASQRLKVLEAKEAKAVKVVGNEKLTDEQRVNKIKGIFGLK